VRALLVPNPPIGVVAALARYSGIALRAAPGRMNGFVTIKWVKDYFLWYKYLNCARAGKGFDVSC